MSTLKAMWWSMVTRLWLCSERSVGEAWVLLRVLGIQTLSYVSLFPNHHKVNQSPLLPACLHSDKQLWPASEPGTEHRDCGQASCPFLQVFVSAYETLHNLLSPPFMYAWKSHIGDTVHFPKRVIIDGKKGSASFKIVILTYIILNFEISVKKVLIFRPARWRSGWKRWPPSQMTCFLPWFPHRPTPVGFPWTSTLMSMTCTHT